jgi:polysaccharide biosynthesis protein PslE
MSEALIPYRSEGAVLQPSRVGWKDVQLFLRRYWAVINCVLFLTIIGTYTTLIFLTEKYQTEAAVIVKLGRENVDPPPTARNTNVFSGIRREEVMSEIEFMRSPDLVRSVVQEIGLDAFKTVRVKPKDLLGQVKFYAKSGARWVKDQYGEALIALNLERRLSDEEKASQEVQQSLAVVYQKDSDVIGLKLIMADPALSRRILSTLLETYASRRIQVKQTPGTEEFLAAETKNLKQRLESLESSKQRWKEQRNLTSAQEQKSLLLRQIREVMAERDGTMRELSTLQKQLEAAQRMIAATPSQLRTSHQESPDPSMLALRQKLTALQSDRAHLLTKFEPSAAQVKAVDEEIESVRGLIGAAQSTDVASVTYQVNPLRTELERKLQDTGIALEGLRSRADVQLKQLTALTAELRGVDSADSDLQSIERERQIAESEYMALVKRKQQADVDSQLDRRRISNISILTPPTSGFLPVYPRKMLLMGVAILIGLVLGVGLSLLLNYMDERIHTPESAESILELPCLGRIEAAAKS